MSRPVILYFFLCQILVSSSDQFQTKFRRLVFTNSFILHVTKRPPVAQDYCQRGIFYLLTNDCIVTLYVKNATPTGFHRSALKTPVFSKSAPGNAKTFSLKAKTYHLSPSRSRVCSSHQDKDRGALTSSTKVGPSTSKFFQTLCFLIHRSWTLVNLSHLLWDFYRSPNVSGIVNLIIVYIYYFILLYI